jgi:FkbM family methyltransferase
MIAIEYGTHDTRIDITSTVKEKCTKESIVYIPPDDNVRAKLFSDPAFGKLKLVFIGEESYDHMTPIFIDRYGTVHTNTIPKEIQEVYPNESVSVSLWALHKNIVLRHGNMKDEFSEQKMALRFLDASSKVLEIGGNIGRNSLIIATILTPSNPLLAPSLAMLPLVTLESDPNIAKQLEENRDANRFRFHVEPSALSLRPLIQRGWDTLVSDTVFEGYTKVNTITLDELRNKYKVPFNTLVLDCEGAFFYILQDMPSILDGIHTILMENDYRNVSHKEYIDSVLSERGFTCVYSEALGPEYAYLKFPCQKNFFEAWKSTS